MPDRPGRGRASTTTFCSRRRPRRRLRAGVRGGLDIRVPDQGAVGCALGQIDDDALLGAAVVRLRTMTSWGDVDQTTGQGNSESAVRSAVSARPLRAPWVLMKYSAQSGPRGRRGPDGQRDELTFGGHQAICRPACGRMGSYARRTPRSSIRVVHRVVRPQGLADRLGPSSTVPPGASLPPGGSGRRAGTLFSIPSASGLIVARSRISCFSDKHGHVGRRHGHTRNGGGPSRTGIPTLSTVCATTIIG